MFLHTPAVRAGEGTWQQMVLLAVHDPALVQGLGTGLGLGKGPGLGQGQGQETGLGPGVGSEQGQEPGLDQPPQSQPQSQLQLQQQLQHIELSLARQLRAVWISHPHADHHLGLLRVLSERRQWLVMAGCASC